MPVAANDIADLIRELTRLAEQSKDTSLFGLLLSLERQTNKAAVNSEVLLAAAKVSILSRQGRLPVATHSRYIE